MPKVLLVGEYADNYLVIGNKSLHVGPDDVALAAAEALAMVGSTPVPATPGDDVPDEPAANDPTAQPV